MFTGITFFVVLFQLGIFIGVIVFAVKLINRLSEISESQKSSADSQAKILKLLASKQQVSESSDS